MKSLFRNVLPIAAFLVLALSTSAGSSFALPSITAEKDASPSLHRLNPPDRDTDSEDGDEPAEAPAKPAHHRHSGDDRVTVFSSNRIAPDESVKGNAVAVAGDLTVEGKVDGDAVAVMGDCTINGTVHGQVVSVLGNLTLGPGARIDGDAICVGGRVYRSADAIVNGNIVNQSFGEHFHVLAPLKAWCLEGHNFWLVWLANLLVLAFYALVALVFPNAIRRTGDMLVARPGLSILSAVLALLVLPILFVLLLITIIGIPIAVIVIPVGLVGLAMFGKASFYALVGRKVSRDRVHPSVAVLIGGLICLLFFMIPVAGIVLSLMLSVVGLGCSIAVLFTSSRRQAPPASPAAGPSVIVPPPPSVPQTEASFGAESPASAAFESHPSAAADSGAESPPVEPAAPPLLHQAPLPAATLPRAGFWIRTGALFIDLLLIGVAFGPIFSHFTLLILATYGAMMWRFKGATVGGIICGLKVVRLDGRAVDWPTAIVRALGCFLSLLAVGLGFVWVAFDPERQSWHDKVAGTTVVRQPRGHSLV